MGTFIYSTDIWGRERLTYEDEEIDDIFSDLGKLKMSIHDKVNELEDLLVSLKQTHIQLKDKIAALDKPTMSSAEHDVFYDLMKQELELLAHIECIQDTLFSLYDIKDNLAFERNY